MKKVLFIMLIVMLLVAFAATVFADQKATPNDNAEWGQIHKNIGVWGYEKVSDAMHDLQVYAAGAGTNVGQMIKEAKP